jgi:hypothetical protein
MSTPEEYERIRALLDALQAKLDAILEKPLPQWKRIDRLDRADAILAEADKSGRAEYFLKAIAHALWAIAFELRKVRDKMK